MITPSPPTTPNIRFIWDDNVGKQFLGERLRVDTDADGAIAPEHRSDSARLQNIVRFLTDIKDPLGELNKQWWASSNAEMIRKEHKELFTMRGDHAEEYRTGHGMFDQQLAGDWASPAFIPAAQLDLITLTLEVLARDSVANAARSQCEAFHVAYEEFKQVAFNQAKEQAMEQHLGQPLTEAQAVSESDQEALAWIENQARDSIETAKRALGSVMQTL
ncbi:hypothetical protein H4582DRAFT_1973743, partial [Lactarius indigo]